MTARIWFLISIIQFSIMYVALIAANVIPPHTANPAIFFRYAMVAILISAISAFLVFLSRHDARFKTPVSRSEKERVFRLLHIGKDGHIKINLLMFPVIAIGAFLLLWGSLAVLNLVNALFDIEGAIHALDPGTILVVALTSILAGIVTPWIYKMEAEYDAARIGNKEYGNRLD